MNLMNLMNLIKQFGVSLEKVSLISHRTSA